MAVGTDIKTFRINYHKTSSSSISNLTGTKRIINDSPNIVVNTMTYEIDFTSNSTNYTYIKIGGTSRGIRYSENGTSWVATYDSGQEPPFIAGWTDNAYKTIEITGGTDVTNSDLIAFLQANATQQIDTSITFELTESGVYKARVCAAGYSPSEYSNSITYPTSPVITDLTGTTWLFNNQISMPPLQGNEYQFNFNFYLTVDSTPGAGFDMTTDDTGLYLDYINIDVAYYDDTWQNDAFKSITITGGTDVTNSDLIAWLEANAVQKDLISFNINSASYYAENGMTWQEWVASEYNTDGFLATSDNYVRSTSGGTKVFYGNMQLVRLSDTIIANGTYTLEAGSSGGAGW